MAEIEIEIDGVKLKAEPSQTVIQVADLAGIYIPRFCYHKSLTIAANCRMCLVEVEKAPKPLPACATPVMPGMKVFTRSQKTIEAQRAVMEFLLVNHPLDCPICDQGGECELQDLSMGFGSSHSDYDECKRAVLDLNLGPLIATEMTRCIHCTRCVRFGDEIAGLRELGATFRGGDTEITTYVQHAMTSEVSGNIIDLCPVGALTSKPFRFRARAWELDQYPTISPHDCLGSNLFVHTRYGEVMRIVSRENAAINETWISDRDRFSYTGIYHEDRVKAPMARINGEWKEIEWQHALEIVAEGLQNTIKQFGANEIAALANPNSTCEEFYLLQKIMHGLGSQNIDYQLREVDAKKQTTSIIPGFTNTIQEIENSDAIILIGSNVQKELPLLSVRLRKAIATGAEIFVINPVDYQFNFVVSNKIIVSPTKMLNVIADLIDVMNSQRTASESDHIMIQDFISKLQNKKSITVILGALAIHHQKAHQLKNLAAQLASLLNAKMNIVTDGANTLGAWLIEHFAHSSNGESKNNLSTNELLKNPRKAYLLLNVEPDLDTFNPQRTIMALTQAQFVIAISIYKNPILEQHADVILPMAAFTETSGTYVNCFSEWQSFKGVAKAYHASRPAWKILRVLGNFLHLSGFDYASSEAIKHELKELINRHDENKNASLNFKNNKIAEDKNQSFSDSQHSTLERVGEIPIYAIDSLVRRADPLQAAQQLMEGDVRSIRMHPKTAEQLQFNNEQYVIVKQENTEVSMVLVFDNRIAENTVWIAGGIHASNQLGDLFGSVQIKASE